MKKTFRIAFMGDLTADAYMPEGTIRLGGAALNSAMWAKRQKAVPTIVSAVGTDNAGKQFIKALRREKLSVSGIQKKRGKTSSIEIFVSEDGERRYGTWDPGVLSSYHLHSKDKKMLSSVDAIVITIYPKYEHVLQEFFQWKQSLKRSRQTQIVINYGDLKEFERSLDVVIRNIDLADILVFGLDKDEDENRINDIRVLTLARKKMAIVTLGKYGSIVWHNGEVFMEPAKDVTAVDTTGAGDSFLAAFLISFLKSGDIQQSLQKGSELAAQVIQKVGAY